MASPNRGDVGAAGDILETGLLAAASKEEEAPAVETTATSTSSGRPAEHEMMPTTRSPVRQGVRRVAAQLQEVFLGTKLFPLFSAVPLAVAAEHFRFARVGTAKNHRSSSLVRAPRFLLISEKPLPAISLLISVL